MPKTGFKNRRSSQTMPFQKSCGGDNTCGMTQPVSKGAAPRKKKGKKKKA
jgi:hypothetical protein